MERHVTGRARLQSCRERFLICAAAPEASSLLPDRPTSPGSSPRRLKPSQNYLHGPTEVRPFPLVRSRAKGERAIPKDAAQQRCGREPASPYNFSRNKLITSSDVITPVNFF